MKPRYWSLAIVLILINYLIFASLFTVLTETNFASGNVTRLPAPTFTPAPAQPIIVVPTPEPVTPEPTATATPVVQPQSGNATTSDVIPANSVQDSLPAELISPGTVNIRSGPGLNYEILGSLNPDTPLPIIGRTADAAWWQVRITTDQTGWVADSVVQTNNTKDVPVVD
ncbi:MAG TPA: SH3 domain-containing protein [Anaerolineae bacterium]|nr:SH3 domain-containing protein [Anaerolineae bacterium]HMR63642.1 SH3 domain-containing protein [Anaerolineae bacterium]